MKQVVYNKNQRVPVKLWLEDIEEGALEQAINLSKLPFAYKHIAIMPDSHQGYGMPIGGVLATKNAIIPNAVGVDIGCGMGAVKTNVKFEQLSKETLKKIMGQIRETIPVGFKHHSEAQDKKLFPAWLPDHKSIVEEELEKAKFQIGTLGGGNHFIEIQRDEDNFIWFMVHSGSRNVGYTTAKHYNQKAKELNQRWFSDVPKELAFFPRGNEYYSKYEQEMNWCVLFAKANRALMIQRIKDAFEDNIKDVGYIVQINKPHNYADIENHFGSNVMVHRKGACRAREGELVMIPGSQGTNSYIVVGKGNKESFTSCSHGAGRVMSRTKAKKTLSVEEESKKLDEMGVLHAIRGRDDLDEAPSSYKDITKVMNNQKDLVDIKHTLTPLGVVKG